DYSMGPFFKTIDTAIMGRKTYEIAKAMDGDDYDKEMATYVMSRTLPPEKREGMAFTQESPATLVSRVRTQKGKHIWMMGNGELAHEFLRADLIDELYLGIVPILIDEGIPLFPSDFPQRNFTLLENKSYSRGLITLRYERVRSKSKKK